MVYNDTTKYRRYLYPGLDLWPSTARRDLNSFCQHIELFLALEECGFNISKDSKRLSLLTRFEMLDAVNDVHNMIYNSTRKSRVRAWPSLELQENRSRLLGDTIPLKIHLLMIRGVGSLLYEIKNRRYLEPLSSFSTIRLLSAFYMKSLATVKKDPKRDVNNMLKKLQQYDRKLRLDMISSIWYYGRGSFSSDPIDKYINVIVCDGMRNNLRRCLVTLMPLVSLVGTCVFLSDHAVWNIISDYLKTKPELEEVPISDYNYAENHIPSNNWYEKTEYLLSMMSDMADGALGHSL